ncbi:hypothetical protein A6D6_03680 [Alcanivorax xiamenensis]|uniref:DUF3899 domain-containing protein n=1 Tax=Alcanivorax xiamenensis TaxID=1177156 RepID=A0ABQ6Y3X7_9GAMM|nr:hypothetical protein A6D6_03680 [Alcanivorax xiamenensis]
MLNEWLNNLYGSFDAIRLTGLGVGLVLFGFIFYLLPQAGDLQFNFRLQEHVLRRQKAHRAADNVRNKRERMEKRLPLYGKSMMVIGFVLFLVGLSWTLY